MLRVKSRVVARSNYLASWGNTVPLMPTEISWCLDQWKYHDP